MFLFLCIIYCFSYIISLAPKVSVEGLSSFREISEDSREGHLWLDSRGNEEVMRKDTGVLMFVSKRKNIPRINPSFVKKRSKLSEEEFSFWLYRSGALSAYPEQVNSANLSDRKKRKSLQKHIESEVKDVEEKIKELNSANSWTREMLSRKARGQEDLMVSQREWDKARHELNKLANEYLDKVKQYQQEVEEYEAEKSREVVLAEEAVSKGLLRIAVKGENLRSTRVSYHEIFPTLTDMPKTEEKVFHAFWASRLVDIDTYPGSISFSVRKNPQMKRDLTEAIRNERERVAKKKKVFVHVLDNSKDEKVAKLLKKRIRRYEAYLEMYLSQLEGDERRESIKNGYLAEMYFKPQQAVGIKSKRFELAYDLKVEARDFWLPRLTAEYAENFPLSDLRRDELFQLRSELEAELERVKRRKFSKDIAVGGRQSNVAELVVAYGNHIERYIAQVEGAIVKELKKEEVEIAREISARERSKVEVLVESGQRHYRQSAKAVNEDAKGKRLQKAIDSALGEEKDLKQHRESFAQPVSRMDRLLNFIHFRKKSRQKKREQRQREVEREMKKYELDKLKERLRYLEEVKRLEEGIYTLEDVNDAEKVVRHREWLEENIKDGKKSITDLKEEEKENRERLEEKRASQDRMIAGYQEAKKEERSAKRKLRLYRNEIFAMSDREREASEEILIGRVEGELFFADNYTFAAKESLVEIELVKQGETLLEDGTALAQLEKNLAQTLDAYQSYLKEIGNLGGADKKWNKRRGTYEWADVEVTQEMLDEGVRIWLKAQADMKARFKKLEESFLASDRDLDPSYQNQLRQEFVQFKERFDNDHKVMDEWIGAQKEMLDIKGVQLGARDEWQRFTLSQKSHVGEESISKTMALRAKCDCRYYEEGEEAYVREGIRELTTKKAREFEEARQELNSQLRPFGTKGLKRGGQALSDLVNQKIKHEEKRKKIVMFLTTRVSSERLSSWVEWLKDLRRVRSQSDYSQVLRQADQLIESYEGVEAEKKGLNKEVKALCQEVQEELLFKEREEAQLSLEQVIADQQVTAEEIRISEERRQALETLEKLEKEEGAGHARNILNELEKEGQDARDDGRKVVKGWELEAEEKVKKESGVATSFQNWKKNMREKRGSSIVPALYENEDAKQAFIFKQTFELARREFLESLNRATEESPSAKGTDIAGRLGYNWTREHEVVLQRRKFDLQMKTEIEQELWIQHQAQDEAQRLLDEAKTEPETEEDVKEELEARLAKQTELFKQLQEIYYQLMVSRGWLFSDGLWMEGKNHVLEEKIERRKKEALLYFKVSKGKLRAANKRQEERLKVIYDLDQSNLTELEKSVVMDVVARVQGTKSGMEGMERGKEAYVENFKKGDEKEGQEEARVLSLSKKIGKVEKWSSQLQKRVAILEKEIVAQEEEGILEEGALKSSESSLSLSSLKGYHLDIKVDKHVDAKSLSKSPSISSSVSSASNLSSTDSDSSGLQSVGSVEDLTTFGAGRGVNANEKKERPVEEVEQRDSGQLSQSSSLSDIFHEVEDGFTSEGVGIATSQDSLSSLVSSQAFETSGSDGKDSERELAGEGTGNDRDSGDLPQDASTSFGLSSSSPVIDLTKSRETSSSFTLTETPSKIDQEEEKKYVLQEEELEELAERERLEELGRLGYGIDNLKNLLEKMEEQRKKGLVYNGTIEDAWLGRMDDPSLWEQGKVGLSEKDVLKSWEEVFVGYYVTLILSNEDIPNVVQLDKDGAPIGYNIAQVRAYLQWEDNAEWATYGLEFLGFLESMEFYLEGQDAYKKVFLTLENLEQNLWEQINEATDSKEYLEEYEEDQVTSMALTGGSYRHSAPTNKQRLEQKFQELKAWLSEHNQKRALLLPGETVDKVQLEIVYENLEGVDDDLPVLRNTYNRATGKMTLVITSRFVEALLEFKKGKADAELLEAHVNQVMLLNELYQLQMKRYHSAQGKALTEEFGIQLEGVSWAKSVLMADKLYEDSVAIMQTCEEFFMVIEPDQERREKFNKMFDWVQAFIDQRRESQEDILDVGQEFVKIAELHQSTNPGANLYLQLEVLKNA